VRLEGRQIVDLPLVSAWERLVDPRVLRACTPGLEKLEPRDADHFDAVLEVKLPAISGRFEGTLEILERRPPDQLRLRLQGKGRSASSTERSRSSSRASTRAPASTTGPTCRSAVRSRAWASACSPA